MSSLLGFARISRDNFAAQIGRAYFSRAQDADANSFCLVERQQMDFCLNFVLSTSIFGPTWLEYPTSFDYLLIQQLEIISEVKTGHK
jgi:hypothetical protein